MVQVRQSTVIDAPVDDVWRVLRDFNGHDRWHPAIATSAIEGALPVDAIGAVRRFRLADGGELREQLLSLSDDKHTLTYCLLEAPLPLMGYVATIRLRPVTDSADTAVNAASPKERGRAVPISGIMSRIEPATTSTSKPITSRSAVGKRKREARFNPTRSIVQCFVKCPPRQARHPSVA